MQTNFIDTLKTKDVSSSHITKDSNKLTTIKSENNYYFEPNISAIIGTLKVEMFYGPPNFGDSPKTDSKEYSYIIHLDTAINVIQTSDSTDFNVTTIGVTKVQLVLLDNLSLYPYLNKRIKVSGQFFGMQTGHHHTDVLMTVSKVEKL